MGQAECAAHRARSLTIWSVAEEGPGGDFRRLALSTDRGEIQARYYETAEAHAGLLWVGGIGGCFGGPAGRLYDRLVPAVSDLGLSSLWLRFRNPRDLDESALDAMAGVALLEALGLSRVGLVGYCFGAAVAIRAAALCPSVQTVVALAGEAHGAEMVDQLSPRSLLLLHGELDDVLPPHSSAGLYARALEPKKLALIAGVGHELIEAHHQVASEMVSWLEQWLAHG